LIAINYDRHMQPLLQRATGLNMYFFVQLLINIVLPPDF